MKRYNRLGTIGRFKPLHNGATAMLEAICENAEQAVIGIGSSNKYDARNPFTPEETREMINLVLSPRFDNYGVLLIPDYGHIPNYRDGQRWREKIVEKFGSLDGFVTGNEYTAKLLKKDYRIIHPDEIIPCSNQIETRGTIIRAEMALGDNWRAYVPAIVAEYLEENGLVERFRSEFGKKAVEEYVKNFRFFCSDKIDTERMHVTA